MITVSKEFRLFLVNLYLIKGTTKHTPLFTTLTPLTYYINAPCLLHIHLPR